MYYMPLKKYESISFGPKFWAFESELFWFQEKVL